MSASLRLLVVAGLLAACAPSGTMPPRAAPARGPLVIERSADLEASARLVAARARTAEVLYLGELHDNPLHHEIQARVLAALVAAGGRPAVE